MQVDVIYPLGTGSRWDNDELRFSLRALEANFLDLGKVFVVGECPAWLTGAIHIPMPDIFRYNKDANLISKILAACHHPDVTSHFVRSSDDELLLKPVRFDELCPFHRGHVRDRSGRNLWRRRMRRTARYLKRCDRTTYAYDCHLPVPVDTEKFRRIMRKAPYERGIGFTIDTLYFNSCNLADHVRVNRKLLRLRRPAPGLRKLRRRMRRATYLNYNDGSLDSTLKKALRQTFPNPSRFEKQDV